MKRLISIALFLFPTILLGQLVTNAGGGPANLVQNVLLGQGVTVSNISYSGSAMAIGQFTATGSNLGLASGIVMTTGTIHNTGAGPHGPNNQPDAGMDNGAGGYSPLNAIAGASTFNAAVLQFDFVPYSDFVEFRYVFGSEEYLEYVNTGFNDAFAFFISGPGIPGGQQNIARLPNTQPVTIDNVHSAGTNINGNTFGAVNGGFYVNNNGGATIQYDGFTTVLTASSNVLCGETYHLIIAIADAGDAIYDSGIFLEANSLQSEVPITITHELSQIVFNDPTILAEGCVTATVTLDRGNINIGAPLTIPLDVFGTATEGVDYTNLPNSVTFPAGVSQIQFSFDAFEDGIPEGQETIILSFSITDPCGNVTPIVLNLSIQDTEPVEVEIIGDEITCPGDEVELFADASGGAPPYEYLWSTGETTPSIFVSPSASDMYTVQVTDACLDQTAFDDFEVVVPDYPPLTLNQTPDLTDICPYVPVLLESNPSGGLAPYTYEWSSNFETGLSTTDTYLSIPSTTTTYTVTVTDFCGEQISADIVYTILSPPLVLEMSPTVEICPGDSTEIFVTPTGGFGQYFYEWVHSGETTQSVWVNPEVTTTYTVIVSDECQTFTVEASMQVVVIEPTANFEIIGPVLFNDLPITFQNSSQGAVSYEWEFGDGQNSTMVHPNNTYDEPGTYYVTLIATNHIGCKDTIQKPISIEEEWYIYIPNTFTPDGDRYNNTFEVSVVGIEILTVQIFNRWGQLIFEDDDPRFKWDGTYNGNYANDGTYTYKINYTTISGRTESIVGHVNVIK